MTEPSVTPGGEAQGTPSDVQQVAGATDEQSAATGGDREAAGAQGTGVSATAAQQAPSTGLPFTGVDLVLIALGGAALLSLGLVMRRLASHGARARPELG